MFDTLLTCTGGPTVVATDQLAALNKQFRDDLERLAKAYKIYVRLDPYYLRNTKWATDLLKIIQDASCSLRRISIRPQMLSYWEILAFTVGRPGEGLLEHSKIRPLRAFIMSDNATLFCPALQLMTNDKDVELDMLAVHKDGLPRGQEWLIGVDGTGELSDANMRAWANKISTHYGTRGLPSLIIGARCEDLEAEISFALLNLEPGGTVIISLPEGPTDALVPYITVFSQSFGETTLRHTLADDRVFLCGVRFTGPPAHKKQALILPPYDNDVALRLAIFTQKVHEWRYNEYEKIFKINDELDKSASAKMFGSRIITYLEAAYPNKANEWAVSTNYLGGP